MRYLLTGLAVFGTLLLVAGVQRLREVLTGRDKDLIEGTIWSAVGIVLGLSMLAGVVYWFTRL
jgi:hypothetical protein